MLLIKKPVYPHFGFVKKPSCFRTRAVRVLFASLGLFAGLSQAEAGLKIYYLRHAEGGHNVVKQWEHVPKAQWPTYVGNQNVFTPKGETQVAAATEKLKKYHFDFIAVSPMWRTRHTILPYLKATGAKGEIWPELHEFDRTSVLFSTNLPAPSGPILNAGPRVELPAEETACFSLRQDGQNNFTLPGGKSPEHNAALRLVVQSVMDLIQKRFGGTDKSLLLVGHGNSGQALLEMLLGEPWKNRPPMRNTGLWMVEEQPDGRFKLELYNDAPALSPAAEGTNLLRNAGFENGLEGWANRTVTGKDGYGHAYPTSIVQEVSSQLAHTGSRSFAMSDPMGNPFWGWLETTVEGCAEGAYSAKVWAKASGNLPDAKLQVYINDKWAKEVRIHPSGTWTQYTVAGLNVPQGSALKVVGWAAAEKGASIFYDDFELSKTGKAVFPATASTVKNNPDPKYNVYFGLLHNHTTYSDAHKPGTPADAFKRAREQGKMDFMGLSDHDWSPAPGPGDLRPADWKATKELADQVTENGKFVAIAGFEWSSHSPNHGHATVFNTEEVCYTAQYGTFEKLLEWAGSRDVLMIFNHPSFRDLASQAEFGHFEPTLVTRQFVGIEDPIWKHSFDQDQGYTPDKYNYYNEALQRGWELSPAMSEDVHEANWGHSPHRIGVWAPELTRKSLIQAFKERRFYATQDRNLRLSFRIDGCEMGREIAPGHYRAQVAASDPDANETIKQVLLFKSGGLFAQFKPASNPVEWSCDLGTCKAGDYFYAQVIEADGDKAWSGAIYVKTPGPAQQRN